MSNADLEKVKGQVLDALNRLETQSEVDAEWGVAMARLAKQYVALERLGVDGLI